MKRERRMVLFLPQCWRWLTWVGWTSWRGGCYGRWSLHHAASQSSPSQPWTVSIEKVKWLPMYTKIIKWLSNGTSFWVMWQSPDPWWSMLCPENIQTFSTDGKFCPPSWWEEIKKWRVWRSWDMNEGLLTLLTHPSISRPLPQTPHVQSHAERFLSLSSAFSLQQPVLLSQRDHSLGSTAPYDPSCDAWWEGEWTNETT